MNRKLRLLLVAATLLASPLVSALPGFARSARAAPGTPSQTKDEAPGGKALAKKPRNAKTEVPIVAYAYSAEGAPGKTFGAYGYGLELAAEGQDSVFGGGVTAWGAPIDRLTIVADAPRDVSGRFTPSLAVLGRILGERSRGWALGALGKWKAEGFGVGPHGDEIESEIEAGVLFSLLAAGFHLDTNALGGFGTGPAGEADVEARLRFGYDVHRLIWLGMDGQVRLRVAGPKYLPNGRTWDFVSAAQILVGDGHFFGAFTAGPTTMGLISDSVGVTAMLSAGGAI